MVNTLVEPTQLRDAVSYQDDSVVSRVVFRSPGGTLTVFAFAEGQGLSEHTNPNDALVLTLDGRVRITVADRDISLEEGQMVHLPANVGHALHGGAPFKMLLTLLKRDPTSSNA